jgi:hypothetical protein
MDTILNADFIIADSYCEIIVIAYVILKDKIEIIF